jgi:predicted amidophosphoribosyltransferase
MNLEIMKHAARQLGADPPGPHGDTPRGWAHTITLTLAKLDSFGAVACAACGRDMVRGLVFCAYCGHPFKEGVTGPLAALQAQPGPDPGPAAGSPAAVDAPRPKRRLLIKAALAGGLTVSDFKGKNDAQLAALVANLAPK